VLLDLSVRRVRLLDRKSLPGRRRKEQGQRTSVILDSILSSLETIAQADFRPSRS